MACLPFNKTLSGELRQALIRRRRCAAPAGADGAEPALAKHFVIC